MSYRLIDANAIASQRPEVNDMPCVYADLPSGLDGGHYDMRESDELQRENEKLHELVRDMWNGMCGYAHDCRSCEHYELYEGQRFVGECEYHRRMRELGVDE